MQLAVPLVAGAFARVLAAIEAVTEALALGLGKILPHVVVDDLVALDILNNTRDTLSL